MGDTVELKSVQDDNKEGREYLEKLLGLTFKGNRDLGKGEFLVQSLITDLGEKDDDRYTDLPAAEQAAQTASDEAGKLFTKLVKSSDGTQSLEDFRSMEPKGRIEKASGLIAALGEVPARRAAFTEIERGAAAKLKKLDPSHKDFKGWNQVRLAGMQGMGRLREALPANYQAVGATWDADLKERLAPFARDKQDRAKSLQEAKGKTKEVGGAVTNLKEATEKYQTRSWDRVSMFNDAGQNGVGISSEDMEKGRKAMDEIVKHGMAILDNGGTFKDVDALMKDAGLTKEMWPPQLVGAVQAWRKTTRALQGERVRKMSDSSGGMPGKDNVMSVIEWVGNYSDLDDAKRGISTDQDPSNKAGLFDMGKDDNALSEQVTKWLGTSVAGLKGVSTVYDLLKNLKGLVDEVSGDKEGTEKLLGVVEKTFESLKTAASGAKSGLDIAGKVGSEALQNTLKKVVPGLGVAIAGAEFLTACKDLFGSAKTLGKAKGEKKEGYVQFLYDEADEAMLGSLSNEVGAQKTKVAKGSVQVFTKALDVTGGATQFGGPHGQLASAGLAIASSGINLGAKAIFTGISWSAAKKARKMVEEAQKGSMEAQIQVFEKSGYYSKMYLAILAKEKHPLAVRYLVNRGIEEGDLDGPVGVEVLRDAMLSASGQENEQDTDGDLLPKLKKVGGMIGTVVMAPEEILKHVATSTYQPSAAPVSFTDDAPLLWEGEWEKGKKTLTGAGLIDVKTGVGEAMKKVAAAAAEAAKQKGKDKEKDALMAAIGVLGAAETTLLRCAPEAFDPKSLMTRIPHEPGRASIANLAGAVGKLTESYWTAVYQVANPGNVGGAWEYAAKPAFTQDSWDKFWAGGQKSAAFPGQDAVKAPLTDALKKQTGFTSALEGVAKRKAATEYVAALDALDDALSQSLDVDAVNRQKSALDFISGFMLLGNAERRAADDVLADADNKAQLDNAGDPFNDLGKIATGWSTIWKSAVSKALTADPKGKSGTFDDDGGFGKSVEAVDGAWNAFVQAKDKAANGQDKGALQARLKRHREVEVAAGKLVKVQAEFGRLHRYSAQPLLTASARLAQRVQGELQKADSDISDLRKKADFTPGETKGGPGKADKLSSMNWRDTYQAAVDSGAVLESSTAKNQISDALKSLKKARKTYDAAKTKKEQKALRKAADELYEACEETIEAVEHIKGYKNYIKNDKMEKELEAISKEAETLKKNAELKQIREGSFGPPTATFKFTKADNSDWQKNKKLAVGAGLTADEESGVGAAIKAYDKTVEAVGKKTKEANGKDLKSEQALALAAGIGEQTRAAELAKSLLDKLKNQYAPWNTYIGELQAALK